MQQKCFKIINKLRLYCAFLVLSGCAAAPTPENVGAMNNMRLCYSMAYGHGEQFVVSEIKRRGIDCNAVLAAAGHGSRTHTTNCNSFGGNTTCQTY